MPLAAVVHVLVTTRYRKKEILCSIFRQAHGVRVTFDEKQETVAPGQSVVFYDGDIVLGGGKVEETF